MLYRLSILMCLCAMSATAAERVSYDQVKGLIKDACYACHNNDKEKGDLNLEELGSHEEYKKHHILLEDMLFVLEEEDMPPRKAKRQITKEERKLLMEYLEGTILELQNAKPNDPGTVIMPRISHREYDYIVRDLSGYNYNISQFLTADNAAGEGFLNVGEAQNMTVGQFESFLNAAKKTFMHARVYPESGLFWYPGPQKEAYSRKDYLKAERAYFTKWLFDKQNAMNKVHGRQVKRAVKMFYGAYLEAAWQFEHRAALGMADADFVAIADAYEFPLFPSAIAKTHAWMTKDESLVPAKGEGMKALFENPFMQPFIERWQALKPSGKDPKQHRKAFQDLDEEIDYVANSHSEFGHKASAIDIREPDRAKHAENRGKTHKGKQPYAIDLSKTDEIYLAVSDLNDPTNDTVAWTGGKIDGKPWQEQLGQPEVVHGNPASFSGGALQVQAPSVLKFKVSKGLKKLEVNLSVVDEMASVQGIIDNKEPENKSMFNRRRVLGGHRKGGKKVIGYLTQVGIITTTNTGYCKFREEHAMAMLEPELAKALGADMKKLTKYHRLNCILALSGEDIVMRLGEEDKQFYDTMLKHLSEIAIDNLENERQTFKSHLQAFVTQVWRRAPSAEEMSGLMAFYDKEREAGAGHDYAAKVPLYASMASPYFIYRYAYKADGDGAQPLDGRALANRLAQVLWGSIPDVELMKCVQDKTLLKPAVLKSQVARMLGDPRMDAFTIEFVGQWLDYNGFKHEVAPDANRFKQFNDKVKNAMEQESLMYFKDLFMNNKSLRNVYKSDYTFLNEDLAKHYGINNVKGAEMRLVKTDGKRGGLLTMGSVLTKFSTPLRTSPVIRGAWLHENVMGFHLPEPPADVGRISDDDTNEEGMNVRQQLERHREDPACFVCHDKIDPLGIALEGLDPIGRYRSKDSSGANIDNQGKFVASGRVLNGLLGLQEYIEEHREDFMRHWCRQFLGYSLGRPVHPTDKELIAKMMSALEADDWKPHSAIQVALSSQQFLQRRNTNE